MFEFLFKYPRVLWQDASLVFAAEWPLWVMAALVIAGALLLLLSLLRQPLGAARRALVFTLQAMMLAVLLAMLWQPALRIETSEPGRSAIAWMLDTSGSMQRIDHEGAGSTTRQQAALDALYQRSRSLDGDFSHRWFAAAEQLEEIAPPAGAASPEPLSREAIEAALADSDVGTASPLQGTLLDALDGSGGNTPVAAVVLASDGAATGTAPDSDWWRELAERGIPVHAVAVGEAAVEDDSALIDVDIAHELIAGVSNEVRLHITHPTTLESMHMRVESASGDLLYASTLDLPGDQAESAHVIRLAVDEPGTRELVFRLLPERLDRVANNNSQSRLVSVVKRPQRVLYVEGEPRWEYKFIRRALASSDAVDIVSLLRTSDHKFYRQGVADAEELAAGLPTTAAAWNRYDAIIIGNLAAASFTGEQQKQLRDYVSERGGSLLMIGGRDTLADGGWSRSLTAAALPVLLDGDVDAVESANRDRASWQARITLKGRRQQWLDISTGRADAPPESDVPLGDGEGSALTRPGESTSAVFGEDATDTAADAGWSDLPALANRQSVGVPRTGAEVLLDALLDDRQEPLLVWHRYGRGTAAVLGTAGTWRWQMGLSHLDQRHERFWQQLLGELTARARPQLDIRNSADVLRDGEAAEIQVVAYDDEFQPLAEPALAATLVRPDGREEQLGLAASADRPGVYGATVPAEEAGPWGVRVALPEGKAGSGALTRERWWMRDALGGERFATRLDSGFLEAIADATGGSFRHIDNIDGLESALVLANAAERHERTLPLWNMPALFLLLLALKLGEWLLRLKWNRL